LPVSENWLFSCAPILFILFPYNGDGEDVLKRGFAPLQANIPFSWKERGQGVRLSFNEKPALPPLKLTESKESDASGWFSR
jgi:hypothetical protein